MGKEKEIRDAIREIVHDHHSDSAMMIGKVVAVDGTKSCDVEIDGVTYHDVQLGAILDNSESSVIVVPKKGSNCLIGNIEIGSGYYMLACDKADKVVSNIAGVSSTIDTNGIVTEFAGTTIKQANDGITIEKAGISLGGILDELIQAINKITVTTAVGPSGPPINLPEFLAIGVKIKTFLK